MPGLAMSTEVQGQNESDKQKQSGDAATARARLQATGRNEPCPCGSTKKYKKCHLQADEAAVAPATTAPDPMQHVNNGWRLFEQRRPGAAEKEFRAALALAPDLMEAQVGIGMAKLSAGDADAARKELGVVVQAGDAKATELREQGVKDAFNRKETQPFVRASHALGCLAYDENQFDEAVSALEKVYTIDEGTVGTEARLIVGKALVKLGRAGEAVPVLEGALKTTAAARARLGLTLAHFAAGDAGKAEEALAQALEANPHFGKALLGKIRKRVDNLLGAAPGSAEEAVVYAQTYGDVWDDKAKAFLEAALGKGEGGAKAQRAAEGAEATSTGG